MPSHEVFVALEDGTLDIGIGGCVIPPDAPTHVCKACDHEFGRPRQSRWE